jgi:superfamily I DNA and/or RNA helicase
MPITPKTGSLFHADSHKGIILDPRTAMPVVEANDVVPTREDFDEEKKEILAKALGVQDILAIEGPPGTGKTKLIAENVVQWLKRNPTNRILLSSQPHIALDNVLERITETELPLEMIRIGRSDETRISQLGPSSCSSGGSRPGSRRCARPPRRTCSVGRSRSRSIARPWRSA